METTIACIGNALERMVRIEGKVDLTIRTLIFALTLIAAVTAILYGLPLGIALSIPLIGGCGTLGIPVIRLMIRYAISPSFTPSKGQLYLAIDEENGPLFTQLLTSFPASLDVKDKKGRTLLGVALQKLNSAPDKAVSYQTFIAPLMERKPQLALLTPPRITHSD